MQRVSTFTARAVCSAARTGSRFASSVPATTTGTASTAVSAAPAPVAAVRPARQPLSTAASNLWSRMVAFSVGLGVGGVVAWLGLRRDVWASTAQLEAALVDLHQEVVKENRALRQRVARLEQAQQD